MHDWLGKTTGPRLRTSTVAWLLLCTAPLLLIVPILWAGALPRGADVGFHIQLANGFVEGFQAGSWYPRWLLDANRGFGSPAPISYPPLGSFLVALLMRVGASPLTAWLLALGLCACAAAWTFYAWAKEFVSPLVGACFATLYTLAPYHALNLYDRFAFAELNAFVWLPLIFKYQGRLHRGGNVLDAVWFALSFSLLAFTHIITAYLVLGFVALYGLTAISSRARWSAVAMTAVAGVLGALLAAVYLAPLALESKYVHPDYFTQANWGAWLRNFVLDNEVARGFKPARIKPAVNANMWWSVAVLAVAIGALLAARRSVAATKIPQWRPLAIAAVVATLLQLSIAAPVWRWVPHLDKVCFPWRLQTFQTLFVVMLLTCAWSSTKHLWGKRLIAALALAGVVLSASFVSRSKRNVDAAMLSSDSVRRTVQAEHIPQGVTPWPKFPGKSESPIVERADASHGANISIERWQPEHRRLRVDAQHNTTVRLRTFHFPGWTATLDDKPVDVRATTDYRVITVDVPAGTHKLDVRFTNTPVRNYAAWTSTLTALSLLGAALWALRRRRAHPSAASTASVAIDTLTDDTDHTTIAFDPRWAGWALASITALIAAPSLYSFLRLVSSRLNESYATGWLEPLFYRSALAAHQGLPLYGPPSFEHTATIYNPGIAVVGSALIDAVGEGYPALRWFSFCCFVALAVVISWWVTRETGSISAGLVSLALVTTLQVPMGRWISAINVDSSSLLLGFLGVSFVARAKLQRWHVIVGGLCITLGFAFKQPVCLLAIPALAQLWWHDRQHGHRGSARELGWFVLACGGSALALVAVLSIASDGWYWTYAFEIPLSTGKRPKPPFVSSVRELHRLASIAPLILCPLLTALGPRHLRALWMPLLLCTLTMAYAGFTKDGGEVNSLLPYYVTGVVSIGMLPLIATRITQHQVRTMVTASLVVITMIGGLWFTHHTYAWTRARARAIDSARPTKGDPPPVYKKEAAFEQALRETIATLPKPVYVGARFFGKDGPLNTHQTGLYEGMSRTRVFDATTHIEPTLAAHHYKSLVLWAYWHNEHFDELVKRYYVRGPRIAKDPLNGLHLHVWRPKHEGGKRDQARHTGQAEETGVNTRVSAVR